MFIGYYSRQNDSNNSTIIAYGGKANVSSGLASATFDCFPISPTAFPPLFAGTSQPAAGGWAYDPVWPQASVCLDQNGVYQVVFDGITHCANQELSNGTGTWGECVHFCADDYTWAGADTSYFYFAWVRSVPFLRHPLKQQTRRECKPGENKAIRSSRTERNEMKSVLICVALRLAIAVAPAQGTVNFLNGPGTLVSVGQPGQETLMSGPAGSYYFGLLIAPPGTLALSQFAFTSTYATNSASSPGRLQGNMNVPVPGWAAGGFMSFSVAGWSASLGHDWNPQWLNGAFGASGDFGMSSIATGQSGAPGAPPLSPLNLFGPATGIQTGFVLAPVPEPSSLALITLAGAIVLLRRPSYRSGDSEERRTLKSDHLQLFARK